MKTNILLSGIIGALLCGPALADSQGSGKLTFTGEVIDAPCTISPDDIDKHVELGEVTAHEINQAGLSTPVAFDLHLQECELTTAVTADNEPVSKVEVTFSSSSVTRDDEQLLDNTLSTGATGVGVRLLTVDEAIVRLDHAQEIALQTESTEQVLSFKARMEKISSGTTVTPGLVEANATYVLAYK